MATLQVTPKELRYIYPLLLVFGLAPVAQNVVYNVYACQSPTENS